MFRPALILGVASLANVATGIALLALTPWFLSTEAYADFAVLSALGLFCAVAGYEWVRVTILRFGGFHESEKAQRYLEGAKCAYLLATVGLTATAISAPVLGVPLLKACVVAAIAISQGVFEGLQAYSRANGRVLRFAIASVLRLLLQVIIVVATAYFSRDGTITAAGQASATLFSLLVSYANLIGRFPLKLKKRDLIEILTFGVPIAASSIFASALPSAIRMMLVIVFPPALAAGYILAVDVGQRVLGALGMALNVAVLQGAIVAAHSGDAVGASRRHCGVIIIVLAPMAATLLMAEPVVRTWLLPSAYQVGYQEMIGAAILAGLILAVRTFGVDAAFLIAEQPRGSYVGSLVCLAVTILIAGSLTTNGLGSLAVNVSLVAGSAAGILASALVLHSRNVSLFPLMYIFKLASGLFAMAAVMAIASFSTPILRIALTPLAVFLFLLITYRANLWSFSYFSHEISAKQPSLPNRFTSDSLDD